MEVDNNLLNMINIFAILLSPAIAVLVSIFLQNRKEKRQTQIHVLTTLIAFRHLPLADDNIKALNLIDLIFNNKPTVRRLWREYFEMLSNSGLETEVGRNQRQQKCLELITEMAKVLGYGKAITSLDVNRVYYPIGLDKTVRRNEEIAEELLRVLKASKGFHILPESTKER